MANTPKVEFTRQQVELLEKQFPEQIAQPTTTEAAMRHTAGQRSVVAFVRSRVQGANNGMA